MTTILASAAYSNFGYDPNAAGSGTSGNVGDYSIDVAIGAEREAVRVLVNDDFFGDQNAQRPQGQVVIHSNRISNSAGFGVLIDSGQRTGDGNVAAQGAPRLLIEENDDRLAPGVAVKNNVIAYNRDGAISYAGDAMPAGQPDAAVPFGRIVNNTLVGGRPRGPAGPARKPAAWDWREHREQCDRDDLEQCHCQL